MLSLVVSKTYLGVFSSCQGAMAKAKELRPNWTIDGCEKCSLPCHKM